MIVQEEVEPYEVVGLFETEDEADRFIRRYMDHYGLDDVSHLEKYHAELDYEGQGPVIEDPDSTEADSGEEREQAGFDDFL